jgi:hypothetical protein
MQPQRPRPRVKWTSSARERVKEEVRGVRARLLQVFTVIDQDLPREAGRYLDAVSPPRYPNCFTWSREAAEGGRLYRIDYIVGKTGWPDVLWVVDVFVRDV